MYGADYEMFRATAEMTPDMRGRQSAHFTMEPVKHPGKSTQAGRPIFDNVEHIRIFTPGDKDTIIHREATEEDKDRYAQEYAAFLRKREQHESGTPLQMWPILDRAKVAELRGFKLFSVESVAKMDEALTSKFPDLAELRQKARDYLAQATGHAPLEQMRAQLTEKENELIQLRRLNKELSSENADLKRQAKKAS